MFVETVLRLNYVVSMQLYVLAERLRSEQCVNFNTLSEKLNNVFFNKHPARSMDARKSLNSPESITFKNFKSISLKNEFENILRKSDSLYENGLYDESLQVLNQTLEEEHAQVLWRQGRVLYRYAMATNEKSKKRKIISIALSKLKDAVQREETCHFIHVWLSVFLLRHAEMNGSSASVFQYMNKAHIHMRRAIELAPNDPVVWFTLAYYEYKLAELPWLQRKIVLSAFSVRPAATYERALEYFKKAETLKPGFSSLNQLMIAKCSIALNNAGHAETYLVNLANNSKVRNEDDKTSKESAEKLLKQLMKRRAAKEK